MPQYKGTSEHSAPAPLPGRKRFRRVKVGDLIDSDRVKKWVKCAGPCGRMVLAICEDGLCGKCAVEKEYERRALAGELSPADMMARQWGRTA